LCDSALQGKVSLQAIVALSTTKIEYISLIEGVGEAILLRGLVSDFGPYKMSLQYFVTVKALFI